MNTTPEDEGYSLLGSKDGDGAGDHDEPYRMGRRKPTTDSPGDFTTRQVARLLAVKATPEATLRRIAEDKKGREGIER